jgi:hypothetical protein
MATNVYIIRIGDNRRDSKTDFDLFMNNIELTGQGKWDKDFKGQMTIGNYLGFIIDKDGKKIVRFFKVKAELPIDSRESWWSEKAYNINNGINGTSKRTPILLTSEHDGPKMWDWKDIKIKLGYSPGCATWMPRGTLRVKKNNLLPFIKQLQVKKTVKRKKLIFI